LEKPLANARGSVSSIQSTRPIRAATVRERFPAFCSSLLTLPEDEIGQIDPLLTVMGGNFVYTEPEFARSMGLPQVGFRGNPTWWLRGTPKGLERRSAD